MVIILVYYYYGFIITAITHIITTATIIKRYSISIMLSFSSVGAVAI